jgi:hypothetical protein
VAIGAEPDSFLILDHGPLGMPPVYSHAHADALSVIVRRNGINIAVDPGTYMYTGGTEWRTYFRSTAAHNTLCVDGRDQASQATAFQWTKPYTAELISTVAEDDGTVILLARHDGYSDIGVTHWRAVLITPDNNILIYDLAQGNGQHQLRLNWHLGGDVRQSKGCFEIELPDELARLSVSGGSLSAIQGTTNPVGAWYSSTYGQKQPITSVQAVFDGKLPHSLVTKIEFGNEPIPVTTIDQHLEHIQAIIEKEAAE